MIVSSSLCLKLPDDSNGCQSNCFPITLIWSLKYYSGFEGETHPETEYINIMFIALEIICEFEQFSPRAEQQTESAVKMSSWDKYWCYSTDNG